MRWQPEETDNRIFEFENTITSGSNHNGNQHHECSSKTRPLIKLNNSTNITFTLRSAANGVQIIIMCNEHDK